jgi:hypothetical protein
MPRKKRVTVNINPQVLLSDNSVLAEAHKIIYGDREKTYGDPSKNLRCIADYWTVHLHHKYGLTAKLNVDDVCQMMVMLKQARLINDPSNRDGKVDTCGYITLMDRCQKAA